MQCRLHNYLTLNKVAGLEEGWNICYTLIKLINKGCCPSSDAKYINVYFFKMSNLTPIISVVVLPKCQSITKICCVWQNPVTLFHTLGSISPISMPSHICRGLYRVIRFRSNISGPQAGALICSAVVPYLLERLQSLSHNL